MGQGMVDLVNAPTTGPAVIAFDTIAEYERYCLCVSGLVYEALARIFSASGREHTWSDSEMKLLISLAVMLQKVDIICDFYEDVERGHHFWPREIWGRPEYGSFANQSDLVKAAERGQVGALYALSGMIVDSLEHSIEALDSLALVKTERVLHFYAIHLTKGIATLEMCFMNKDVFTTQLNMPKADIAQVSHYHLSFSY
jgi:farnesyl-diphosphate farnesyltransferase